MSLDAMETAAYGGGNGNGAAIAEFVPVDSGDMDLNALGGNAARVDGFGNRAPENAGAPKAAAPSATPDYANVIDQRFTALQQGFQQQLQQQSQTFVHALNEVVSRLTPSQAAAVQEAAAEPDSLFAGIQESMAAEDWASLPNETKQALRVIEAHNRRNFETILSKLPNGQSPELKAALDKVASLEKTFTESQEKARFNAIAQEAQAAKAKYDPEGKGVLALYQGKIAQAIQNLGMNVDEAIRHAAPEVWLKHALQAELAKVTPQIQNDAVAALVGGGLFGPGAPSGDGIRNLNYEDGETAAQSMQKVLAKLGLGRG
ncbi:MAG: hypothetical protein IT366_24550 [Candidatus Hydrogenedentes bacterium]|nr:hypothetical protein [Candidatus Hydrogenedentota bacterium]